MKNWAFILMLFLLIIVSGISGYILHRPKYVINEVPVLRQDPKQTAKIDSFATVVMVHEYVIDSLNRKLSRYASSVQTHYSASLPSLPDLPCDTAHIIDTLLNDISIQHNIIGIKNQIINNYDTITAQQSRFITYLRNEIYTGNDRFADLQYRHNMEAIEAKKRVKRSFLIGAGSGAAASIIFLILI